MTIEPLEARIAPAGFARTFTDVDGDLVTLKISKGAEADVFIDLSPASGPFSGRQLKVLKLQDTGDFRGASVSLTARLQDANGDGVLDGDGRVNLGFFDAGLPIGMIGGKDLGVVTFGGDVGKVRIGDWSGANGLSFTSLTLGSLGLFGTSTGAPDLVSDIYGKAGALKIAGDLAAGATFHTSNFNQSTANLASVTITGSVAGILTTSATRAVISGDVTGRVEGGVYGMLDIKGSLLGGTADESGLLKNFSVTTLRIAGDVRGGAGERSGGILNTLAGVFDGRLGAIIIGGSVSGGAGDHSGIILNGHGPETIVSVTIGGDLRGGAGDGSGRISEKPDLTPAQSVQVRSVTIGGSLIGGSGRLSGMLDTRSDNDDPLSTRTVVKIGRDFVAGGAPDAGRITLQSPRSVEIGGSFIGGSELRSGLLTILSGVEIERIKVGGDVRGVIQGGNTSVREFFLGGSLLDGSAAANSGISLGRVAKFTVGGDLRGMISAQSIGTGTIGGSIDSNGVAGVAALNVDEQIGSLVIGGSVLDASINAGGDLTFYQGGVMLIGPLKVGGSVERSTISAGGSADAQIGAVTVGGDWVASRLRAGVSGGGDGVFGTGDDTKLGFQDRPDAEGKISRIASLTIKGMALGSLAGNDSAIFEIIAQEIGAISIGGKAELMQKGPGNDTFILRNSLGATLHADGSGDVRAFEVPVAGATPAPVRLPAAPRPAAGADFFYTDVDGDLVSVVFSIGTSPSTLEARGPFATGRQLTAINLASDNEDTNITITAQRQDANGDGILDGDGLVNVGQINANGVALGIITIRGDLGAIDAASVKSISALSLGRFGTTTGAFDTTSSIAGAVGTVTLGTDLVGSLRAQAFTSVSAGGSLTGSVFTTSGAIGKLTVGRDLRGVVDAPTIGAVTIGGSAFGDVASSGKLSATTRFTGAVKIGKNFGGFFENAGRLYTGGDLPGLTIGGSVLGLNTSAGTIQVLGKLGGVTVAGNLDGAATSAATVSTNGVLTKLAVGGSILATATQAATVSAQAIGTATIGREVLATAPGASITATDGITVLTIGGSLHARNGVSSSAAIFSQGHLGTVKIGGDIVGSGTESGYLTAAGAIKSLTIGGSVLGAAATRTGAIFAGGAITTAKIGRDIVGGTFLDGAAAFERSGYLEALRLGSLTIGGSIRAGANLSTTTSTDFNGSIRVVYDIGSLTVLGSTVGFTRLDASPSQSISVVITARGQAVATGRTDLAIGKITIGGRAEETIIRAGYLPNLLARNADAQIGAVTVGGDWRASTIVAGLEPNLGGYGNADDAKINDPGVKDLLDSTGAISRIASITIKSTALGSLSATDARNFAIAAQQIGALQIGAVKFPLKTGLSNDSFAATAARRLGPTTGAATPDGSDFHAFEI